MVFGLLSAYFPPLNAEIYAIAAPVIFPDLWAVHVAAMTLGLVIGKVTHFVAAAKGADVITRHRRAADERAREHAGVPDEEAGARQRFRRRLTRWSKAMIDVLDRPRLGPLVTLASAGVGFPPLAVVVVAAGVKHVAAAPFVLVMTVGCLVRFLVTAWLVQQGIGIGS